MINETSGLSEGNLSKWLHKKYATNLFSRTFRELVTLSNPLIDRLVDN